MTRDRKQQIAFEAVRRMLIENPRTTFTPAQLLADITVRIDTDEIELAGYDDGYDDDDDDQQPAPPVPFDPEADEIPF